MFTYGSGQYEVTIDPTNHADWWDGPQAQCEIALGLFLRDREGVRYKRRNLSRFRITNSLAGYVEARTEHGRVSLRDVGLCPKAPAPIREEITPADPLPAVPAYIPNIYAQQANVWVEQAQANVWVDVQNFGAPAQDLPAPAPRRRGA